MPPTPFVLQMNGEAWASQNSTLLIEMAANEAAAAAATTTSESELFKLTAAIDRLANAIVVSTREVREEAMLWIIVLAMAIVLIQSHRSWERRGNGYLG